jgi:drug/metabolite transporter (DMT)-like permease
MLVGCVAFAVMYALVHQLRNACDWQIIAFVRAALACLFAMSLARASGAQLVFLRPGSLWMRSLAGSFSLICGFYAVTRDVPASTVLAISNVFPIWVALLAWPMLGLKPGWSIMLSVVTAVAGVVIMCAPWLNESGSFLDVNDQTTVGAFFAFCASMATAVAMLGLHRLHWINTHAIVAHFSAVSMFACIAALFCFPLKMPLENLLHMGTLLMLLGVGVSATAGQICLTKAFTVGAPAEVAVFNLFTVVFMLCFDVTLFGRTLAWWNLVGMALVMVPTAWVIVSHRLKARSPEVEPVLAEGRQPIAESR